MIDFKKFLSLAFCLLFACLATTADEVLPKVVVKVGESTISNDDLVKRLLEEDGSRILDNLIAEKVIELELTAMKLPLVSEKQVDGHISLMEKQLQMMQGPYANIDTFLANTKMKMSDLRRKAKREIGLRRILGHAIEVKDEEVLKHYDEFKTQFYTSPEARRVVAITVFHRESPAPKMLQTDRTEAEAKSIAEGIRKSWVENPDYVKTLWDTKQHYIRGYDQPYGVPMTMRQEKNFVSVFNTPIGKITDVILDKNGFNIYRVVEDLPARVIPFDEVKERIKNELIANKIEKAINDGEFEKIKKKYKVERFVDLKEPK